MIVSVSRVGEQPTVAQRKVATEPDDPPVREPSWEEGRALLDGEARRLLGISGEEFLRRYDAGDYARLTEDDELGRAVLRLWFLIPFARESGAEW